MDQIINTAIDHAVSFLGTGLRYDLAIELIGALLFTLAGISLLWIRRFFQKAEITAHEFNFYNTMTDVLSEFAHLAGERSSENNQKTDAAPDPNNGESQARIEDNTNDTISHIIGRMNARNDVLKDISKDGFKKKDRKTIERLTKRIESFCADKKDRRRYSAKLRQDIGDVVSDLENIIDELSLPAKFKSALTEKCREISTSKRDPA